MEAEVEVAGCGLRVAGCGFDERYNSQPATRNLYRPPPISKIVPVT
jgi:hypothetical protein